MTAVCFEHIDKTSCFDVSGVPFSPRGYTTSNAAKTRTAVGEKKQTAEMRDGNKTAEKTAGNCGNWLFHNVAAASLLKWREDTQCVCVWGGVLHVVICLNIQSVKQN